jgi:mercuric ion binding protein
MTRIENCRTAPNHRIAAGIKLPQASNCRRHQIGFAIKFPPESNFLRNQISFGIKPLIVLLLTLFTIGVARAQEKEQKFQTVVIQTSAECGDCKDRIEEALNYTKGVVFAELDLETKKVTVKFATKKISLQQVKDAISAIGYDADEVKAESKAQLSLPKCCQPNGMKNL